MTTATRTNLSDTKNVSEALEQFNYEVAPMELIRADGKSVVTHKATVRMDTSAQMGIVGIGYGIIQMAEATDMIKSICQGISGSRLKSATIFDGGRRCHLTAKIGEFQINGKFGIDTVEKLITVVNSFDGSTNYSVIFEEMRKVCANGMRRAVKTSSVNLRHSGDVESKLQQSLVIMGKAESHFKEIEMVCNSLANKLIDRRMVEGLIAEVVGDLESTRAKNIAQEIEHLIGNGIDTHATTAWDALNAVTEYYDHHAGKDEEKRLASSLIGSGANKKASALEYLISA